MKQKIHIALAILLGLFNVTTATVQFHTVSEKHASNVPHKPGVSAPVPVVSQKQQERTSHAISTAYPLSHIEVTSPYGIRRDPFTKKRSRHNGLDLKAYYVPTFAMFYGRVIRTGRNKRAGLYVTTQHGSITISYCHLSSIAVKVGTAVTPGTILGLTGNTGRSTGPHLHLTAKKDGKKINPAILLEFIQKCKVD